MKFIATVLLTSALALSACGPNGPQPGTFVTPNGAGAQ